MAILIITLYLGNASKQTFKWFCHSFTPKTGMEILNLPGFSSFLFLWAVIFFHFYGPIRFAYSTLDSDFEALAI